MTAEPEPDACPHCDQRLYYFQQSCPSCERSVEWDIRCVQCGTPVVEGGENCPGCGMAHPRWRVIEQLLITNGEPLRVAKDALDRPMRAGYSRHLGSVKGQWADYRRQLENGAEAHVRTYGDHYEIHLDTVGALDSPGKHAVWYTPRVVADGGIQVIETVTKALSYSGRLVSRLFGRSDTNGEKH